MGTVMPTTGFEAPTCCSLAIMRGRTGSVDEVPRTISSSSLM